MRDRDVTSQDSAPAEPAKGAGVAPADELSQAASASIRRNTVLGFLAQITTGAFTTVLTLYLVRALGPDGYGVFALALGIAVVVGLVADFGIPHSAARFLAESRGDRDTVTRLLVDALRLKLAAAALATGGLFVAAGPLSEAYDKPALAWPLRVLALSLFAESVLRLYLSAFVALARVAVNLRLIFFESLVETVASIGLVALGAGATGAAIGRGAGYAFGAILAVAVVGRLLGRSAIQPLRRDGGRIREIGAYAAPLFVTNSAYIIYAQVDVLIIGALLNTTAVGIFTAPLRLVVPLGYVAQAAADSVAPRQAKKQRSPRSTQAFQTSLRLLILFQAVFLAPVIVWAEPIVQLLFGSAFADSAEVLRVLSLYIFLRGLSPLLSSTVNYLGRAARRIPIVLFALATNVAIDLALLPAIGVVGAAIGTGVAYAIYVPAHFFICRKELGLRVRPLAVTLLRAMFAAAVMSLVLFAFGTETLSLWEWLVGGLAGLTAFCGALLVGGEITRSELRQGRRVAATQLSRLASFALP
jgi:O-antigen/teichoic acid export membrane protein